MTRCLWLYFTETNILRRSDSSPHRCICTSRRSRSSPSSRHPSLISTEQISLLRTDTNALISTGKLQSSSQEIIFSLYGYSDIAGPPSPPVQFFLLLEIVNSVERSWRRWVFKCWNFHKFKLMLQWLLNHFSFFPIFLTALKKRIFLGKKSEKGKEIKKENINYFMYFFFNFSRVMKNLGVRYFVNQLRRKVEKMIEIVYNYVFWFDLIMCFDSI